ncbi:Nucleotide-binding universal stress protein, UspA family [Luteibacter sp. UNCMF331Sha3.1]|uniref:universal stress protein n=1 Tax=Luteibacter sp. UNCMF331Sha3.1 TaxID=1502760 RepID=UPI0008BB3479|nr:universal stress protein [Luteibacter sp. UNCMF331Sha3.1]SEN19595.1 Nucleotide-binding universal stress protein, UspA family [Luteibacter sp. UNCMF331Sha3.1]
MASPKVTQLIQVNRQDDALAKNGAARQREDCAMSTAPRTTPEHATEPSAAWRDIGSLAAQLPCDGAALAGAAAIAGATHARITVTQLLPLPVDTASAWALAMDPMVAERHERIRLDARRQADDIRHRMAAYAVPGDITTLESLFDEPASLAAMAARRTDISVMARPSGSVTDAAYTHAVFAGLLLGSGRPVLVMPEGSKLALPVKHAVVAWTDTSQATRAMHDAMPLLLHAGAVDLVTIDPPASPLESQANAGDGAAQLLQAHGIPVTVHRIRGQGRAASQLLLDHCRTVNADLLVAGGYGHARWREWAVGGTTREIFFETSLPTFFAH